MKLTEWQSGVKIAELHIKKKVTSLTIFYKELWLCQTVCLRYQTKIISCNHWSTKIEKLLSEGIIEILPFPFMRGRTLVNSCVIVDEAQNVTMSQMEMVLGRLGIGSKIMICGDTSQIDLKNKKESGLDFMNTLAARVPGVKVITLKKNHRHPIVPEILDVYREYTT